MSYCASQLNLMVALTEYHTSYLLVIYNRYHVKPLIINYVYNLQHQLHQ